MRSPEWSHGRFVNPQPLHNAWVGSLAALFKPSPFVRPVAPVSTVPVPPGALDAAPVGGLRVTWFGHSSTLIELDGVRVLTDPIWSRRASPLGWAGPARYFPPVVALGDLPHVDVVLISHDHYDHLDMKTVQAMKDWDTLFIVPLGVGAHLESFGVPAAHIVELDWWERWAVGGIEVTLTPARHASGRFLFDNDAKLWGGFALVGPAHRVYLSGDSGLFPGLKDIGARLGPFDLTMIEVGQYNPAWPDWHMGPEQAVTAHQWVRGRALLPVHWGLFALAAHGWTEPIERVTAEGARRKETVFTPRPGQRVDVLAPPVFERWWPKVPFHTAAEDPIHSTQLE